MLIKRISIYQEFHCIGADCPVSCCRGWKIPINHEIYLKYLHQKGLFGAVLKLLMIKKKILSHFEIHWNDAPFGVSITSVPYRKNMERIICRLYVSNFQGSLHQLTFLRGNTISGLPWSSQTLSQICGRKPAISVWRNNRWSPLSSSYNKWWWSFFKLFGKIKNRTDWTAVSRIWIWLHCNSALWTWCSKCLPFQTSSSQPSWLFSETQEYILFDCALLNHLFLNGFYHPMLRKSSPLLFKLCKKYINNICNLFKRNPKAAEKKRSELIRTFQNKVPNSDRLLNRYFEYYLQTNFLDIFEDYSFSKHVFLGAAKTAMLQIFIGLYAENKKAVTNEDLSTIIAVFERRAPQIEDAIKISLPSSTRIRSVTGPRITPPIP